MVFSRKQCFFSWRGSHYLKHSAKSLSRCFNTSFMYLLNGVFYRISTARLKLIIQKIKPWYSVCDLLEVHQTLSLFPAQFVHAVIFPKRIIPLPVYTRSAKLPQKQMLAKGLLWWWSYIFKYRSALWIYLLYIILFCILFSLIFFSINASSHSPQLKG